MLLCLETGTLPEAGGLFDQDPEWVRKLMAVRRAVVRRKEREEGRGRGTHHP